MRLLIWHGVSPLVYLKHKYKISLTPLLCLVASPATGRGFVPESRRASTGRAAATAFVLATEQWTRGFSRAAATKLCQILNVSVVLLCTSLVQKPCWSVASSVLANPPHHESALTPGPNDVCRFVAALDVGSRDLSAKRNIWLLSGWSSECKGSHLQRGWRAEPCPRAKQGVNQPDNTETPSEIYFHFWPIFSRELIFCCHTSSNSCQDSKFSHFCACSEQRQASWWQQRLSWGCHHVHHAPWIFHGHDVSVPAAPRTAGTHATATLMLPNRRPLPLQSSSVACAADGSHPLSEPHLSKQHREGAK